MSMRHDFMHVSGGPWDVASGHDHLTVLAEDLPAYHRPGLPHIGGSDYRRRQLHAFSLEDAENYPWVTLQLTSMAPSNRSLPIYFQGQPISGEVRLDLQKSEGIKSIIVTVEGLVCAGFEEVVFFNHSETLWDTSHGDPRSPDPLRRSDYAEKLRGLYSWKFSIPLSTKAIISAKPQKKLGLIGPSDVLPPYFSGVRGNVAINYRLTLLIRRRGPLKPVNNLTTLIGYTPLSRPSAPSLARQKSYEENAPIQDPLKDPNGWHVLQDVRVTGSLFRQRMVTANYVLALALPLTYTRGTIIPFFLRVYSSDIHALDLLSSPRAPHVVLRRTLTVPPTFPRASSPARTTLGMDFDNEQLARAIWAPASSSNAEVVEEEGCRVLLGELSVPHGCTPSFLFGKLALEYFVDVCLPAPAGFQPEHPDVVASVPVNIASAHAEGAARPRAYITPAHDVSRRVAEADVGVSSMQLGSQSVALRTDSLPSTGASPSIKKGRRFSLFQ